MEHKYKNRTYWIESFKNCFSVVSPSSVSGGKEILAQWLGYSAYGQSKDEACEKCHQMIEEDMNEADMLRQESELE